MVYCLLYWYSHKLYRRQLTHLIWSNESFIICIDKCVCVCVSVCSCFFTIWKEILIKLVRKSIVSEGDICFRFEKWTEIRHYKMQISLWYRGYMSVGMICWEILPTGYPNRRTVGKIGLTQRVETKWCAYIHSGVPWWITTFVGGNIVKPA